MKSIGSVNVSIVTEIWVAVEVEVEGTTSG
jgi:hypothetical protein